jgi:hypothetical protein
MAKKSYSELLKDPRWQKKRLEIFLRDKFTCTECLRTEITLHVHHKHYEYGKNPWDYEEKYLVTVCEVCHSTEENIKKGNPDIAILAKAANVTCFRLWRIMTVYAFVAHEHPELYKQFMDPLKNTIGKPPLEKEWTNFIERTLHG